MPYLVVSSTNKTNNNVIDEIKRLLVVDEVIVQMFNRILIFYENAKKCEEALSIVQKNLIDISVKILDKIVVNNFLDVPENEKNFAISPPTSPPVCWIQTKESLPTSWDIQCFEAELAGRLLSPGDEFTLFTTNSCNLPDIKISSHLDDFNET